MIYKILNINELNIEEISKGVSLNRIERASKIKHETSKKRSIAVEYLLNKLVEECREERIYNCDKIKEIPVQLIYDDKGKPHMHLDDDSVGDGAVKEIYFSLSHSGDYVACMISDRPCGIDIEKHSDRPYEKIANRICTENERNDISSKEDFYTYWTLKESALKAIGLGLSLDMKKVQIKKQNNKDMENEYYTELDSTYSGNTLSAPDGYSLSYLELK